MTGFCDESPGIFTSGCKSWQVRTKSVGAGQIRSRSGEPGFEYFAPSYVWVRKQHGELVRTNHPLLCNYVFIHASEGEIYRMKRFLPQFNFLPRVREKDDACYPYLSDEAMENLKWATASYSDVLPGLHAWSRTTDEGRPDPHYRGQFKGGVRPASSFSPEGPQGGDGLCGELHVCAAALCRTRAI